MRVQDTATMWHYLMYDVYPATPRAADWVTPCLQACEAWRMGESERLIRLPAGLVSASGAEMVAASVIVEMFGLYRTAWCESDADEMGE